MTLFISETLTKGVLIITVLLRYRKSRILKYYGTPSAKESRLTCITSILNT
jgi:hypothetical protein